MKVVLFISLCFVSVFIGCKHDLKYRLIQQKNKPIIDSAKEVERLGYNPYKSASFLAYIDTAKIWHRTYDDLRPDVNEIQYQIYYEQCKIGIKHVFAKEFQEPEEHWTFSVLLKNGETYLTDDLFPSKNVSKQVKDAIIKKLIK